MSIHLRWSSCLRLAAITLIGVALPVIGVGRVDAQSASALQQGSAAGYCTTDDGVTVVLDLSALDGPIVVRCVKGPLPSSYNGWDALEDAGVNPQMPSRTPGFICRLAGEPAESRSLDIPGDDDYHEECVNTPPTSAYWGYWYAKNGGKWSYSTSSAAGHHVIKGGFEGWAFSLNSGGKPPMPGVAPSHRVEPTAPPPSTTPPSGGTTSGDQPSSEPSTTSPSTKPSRSDTPATHQPSGRPDDNDDDDDDTESPTSAAAGPTSTPSTSDVEVTGEVPEADNAESSGSPLPTVLGIGVLVLLGVGAGVTAWRRSHRA